MTPRTLAFLFALHTAPALAAFNPAFCQSVNRTLDIHWQSIVGVNTPCTGIEFTDGTLADADDGTITMTGTGVSNPACIATGAYTFTLSADRTRLVGFDTASNVPMTLTRTPGLPCFVGTWSLGPDVYEAYIYAGAFAPLPPTVPALDPAHLVVLAMLLAMGGALELRRRSQRGT
jgi:hypothetical protein